MFQENPVHNVDFTGAHHFQRFIVIGDNQELYHIQIGEPVLGITFIMSPVIGVLPQRRRFPGNKILQNIRPRADGVVPVGEVAPFLDCLRIFQTLRLISIMQCFNDVFRVERLKPENNRIFVRGGYGYQIF